jgi:RimJ/RimL family protein N-acetyltransferase
MTGLRRLTERLVLEPITPRHVDELAGLHADPAVARWYGVLDRAEVAAFAAAQESGWRTAGVGKWIAHHRDTGALVGRGGLSRLAADSVMTRRIAAALPDGDAWAEHRLEVGWVLAGAHHGHGYATELGHCALDVAFAELGASAVVAFTEEHNLASRAVMERLGMRHAGTVAAHGFRADREGLHDDAPFALYDAHDVRPRGSGGRRPRA